MIKLGRIRLWAPTSWSEQVGEAFGRVAGAPVPGARGGLAVSADFDTYTEQLSDTAPERRRVKRQLRSLLNNLHACRLGIWVEWDDDPEQDGWYVPGQGALAPIDRAGLGAGIWALTGIEWARLGHPRTHRLAVEAYLRDRRISTTARDTKMTNYSADFAGMTPLALTWLPADVYDPAIAGLPVLSTAPRTTIDGGEIVAAVSVPDLAIVSFEQDAGHRELGDVVLRDRRGVLGVTPSLPDPSWEEFYGPDWPASADDVPIIENGLCRISYVAGAVPRFRVDVYVSGSGWVEQGSLIASRIGVSEGDLDMLLSAQALEWTPDRGMVQVVMRRASDANSREVIIITLQRGWRGPRVEVYPATMDDGSKAGASLRYIVRDVAAVATLTKLDSGSAYVLVTTDGTTGQFASAAVGATTFTGENWVAMRSSGNIYGPVFSVLQAAARATAGLDAAVAYGALRNAVSISAPVLGYLSVHMDYIPVSDLAQEAEAQALGSGTTVVADTAAIGGSAAAATRTASATHVSRAAWPTAGTYRIYVRARYVAGGGGSGQTVNVRAVTSAGQTSTVQTTSATYVWLSLGTAIVDGAAPFSVDAWLTGGTAGGAVRVDRIEVVRLEGRTGTEAAYDGAHDVGAAVLYDSRSPQRIVAR